MGCNTKHKSPFRRHVYPGGRQWQTQASQSATRRHPTAYWRWTRGYLRVFTAIMLRKLCERLPKFLADDQVTLFAGTSAGALNALLLAKHENPRQVIMNRTLEAAFRDDRTYGNRLNPVTGMLSLFGLASWSGKADLNSVLQEHFGNMRMKDLKHRVLITAFDLWGTRESGSPEQRWRPKVFYNFPAEEPDRELYVKDVAYGAASPLPCARWSTASRTAASSRRSVDQCHHQDRKPGARIQGPAGALLSEDLHDLPGGQREGVGLSHLLTGEQPRRIADLLSELQSLARQRDESWDRDRLLSGRLDAKRADLVGGAYARMAREATDAFQFLMSLLDLWRVWTSKPGSLQGSLSRELNPDEWGKIKASLPV